MAGLGGPEIILIVLVILLMFGGKKLPELMRFRPGHERI
jgi:sec-independent protein translocase protein TatA